MNTNIKEHNLNELELVNGEGIRKYDIKGSKQGLPDTIGGWGNPLDIGGCCNGEPHKFADTGFTRPFDGCDSRYLKQQMCWGCYQTRWVICVGY